MRECQKSSGVAVTQGRTLNHVAHVYDLLSPVMTFYQESRLAARAMAQLELGDKKNILDIGCGTGSVTLAIAKTLARNTNSLVVGLDAADKMIAVARRKAKNVRNVRFDTAIAEDLPYENESFDGIISTFFFHHVNFALKQKVLREMWRVLKINGKAVIVDVDIPVNLFGYLCAWAGYFLFRQEEIKENIEGKLREAMRGSNFSALQRIATHQGYISIFTLTK